MDEYSNDPEYLEKTYGLTEPFTLEEWLWKVKGVVLSPEDLKSFEAYAKEFLPRVKGENLDGTS